MMKETFEYVLNKILEQGEPSLNKDGKCLYRGPNGLKCAAGHLISDEEYNPSMEGRGARHTLSSHPHMELISQMQIAHDIASANPSNFVREFKSRMDRIKEQFNIYD